MFLSGVRKNLRAVYYNNFPIEQFLSVLSTVVFFGAGRTRYVIVVCWMVSCGNDGGKLARLSCSEYLPCQELRQPRMLCCHWLPPGMYWGHLGHFHRAISHLKWYKIVCMRYLACIFSQMKSLICFSSFRNLEFPDISVGDLLRFEYITSLFSCLCMSILTSNSSPRLPQGHRIEGLWAFDN